MTSPRITPPAASPPWLFSLMCLTGAGFAVILWLVFSSAHSRSVDARRHAALQTELLRLDQAQSAAYARSGHYATTLGSASGGDGLDFTASPGLQLEFESFSGESWHAVVRDTALTTAPSSCGIFRGPPQASPHRAVVRQGVVACW
ncbi:MAG: hypothetical protein V4503_08085 [Gemmatimonadota bacterium]